MSDDRLTVTDLAAAKGILVEFLTAVGVQNRSFGVEISYGEGKRARVRKSVKAGEGSRWSTHEASIVAYGLHFHQLEWAASQRRLLLVEGESDAWSAWIHGRAALGVPGARMTKVLMPHYFDDVGAVYVVKEPDSGGTAFLADVRAVFRKFEEDGHRGPEVYALTLDGDKDVNELHQRTLIEPGLFEKELDRAMEIAVRIWPPDPAFVALFASFADQRDPFPELDEKALYGLAGDVVRTWEPHTEADPAALLFELLSGFGNLVGQGPVAMGGAEHRAKVFVIITGKTSRGRKGTGHYNIMILLSEVDHEWASDGVTGGTASGEGIIRAAAERNGKPLTVVESEFSRVLKVASRDGSIVTEVIRQAWDGTSLHNATARDPVHVHDAHVTLIGHATVEELLGRMDHIDIFNGFANRFLVVAAQRSKRLPDGGGLPDDERRRLVRDLKAAAKKAKKTTLMTRSDEGVAAWANWYLGVPDDEPGLVGAVTARAEAQVLRLQMIYALLDGTSTIEAEHVEAAIAAWDYCVQSARWLFGDRLGDPDAEKLIEALVDAPTGLDSTEIAAIYQRHRTADQISGIKERADKWLRRRELHLDETREPTGGRPRTITRIAPISGEESGRSDQSHPDHAEDRGDDDS